MKRRQLLLNGIGLAAWTARPAVAAKEFWNNKPSAEWSESEVTQLLTRSPWAREATAVFKMDGNMGGMPGGGPGGGGRGGGMGGPGGGGMPGGGGPPGGGMGGPPGGMPEGGGPGGMPQIKVLVRWESARPLREARKSPTGDESFYIISMSGFPAMSGGPRGRNTQGANPEEMRAAMLARLKDSSSLTCKGKAPIAPDRIEPDRTGKGDITLFLSREGHPIQLQDKEVVFATRMGPLELKVKFLLMEMVYRSKLEL